MVIFAGIKTNVTDVQRNESLDRDYRLTFKQRRGSEELDSVVLQGDSCGRNHELYPNEGYLALRNVQSFGGPDVTQALLGEDIEFPLVNGVYTPNTYITNLNLFKRGLPTIFHLERVSQNPVEINGLEDLNADGSHEFHATDSYFLKEKVDAFIAKYNEAKGNSTHGFPVLEGYMTWIRKNRNYEVLSAVFGEDLVRKLSVKK